MNVKISSILLTLTFLISACGSAPATPSISSEDLQSTAVAIAFTMVAETQAALPTNTLPPTETPLPTFTHTPESSPTPNLTLTLDALTPAVQPTATGNDPCNKPLTSWNVPTASFTIVNETQPKGTILLLMSAATSHGECGWLPIYGNSFSGPVGMYSAAAFVDGQKDFKVYASFQIQAGKWKIVVRNDRIVALGVCYPNC